MCDPHLGRRHRLTMRMTGVPSSVTTASAFALSSSSGRSVLTDRPYLASTSCHSFVVSRPGTLQRVRMRLFRPRTACREGGQQDKGSDQRRPREAYGRETVEPGKRPARVDLPFEFQIHGVSGVRGRNHLTFYTT